MLPGTALKSTYSPNHCLLRYCRQCLQQCLQQLGLFLMLASGIACAAPNPAPDGFGFLQPRFETINNDELMTELVITALAQDTQGFIWVATQNGLIRYDGYRCRIFRRNNNDRHSLAGDYIVSLAAGKDGRIWAGTLSDGLSVYDPATEAFEHFTHDPRQASSLSAGKVLALLGDTQGGQWVATNEGLDYLPLGAKQFRHYRHEPSQPNSLQDNRVRSLLQDKTGRLWVGTVNGLQTLDIGAKEFEPAAQNAFAGKDIQALFQAQDGKIWVGTKAHGAAFVKLDGSVHWVGGQAQETSLSVSLSHAWVRDFAQMQADQIWLATPGAGIHVLSASDGQVLQQLRHDPTVPGSLTHDSVVPLLLDRAGLLWIGTWGGGLQRFTKQNNITGILRHGPGLTNGLSQAIVTSVLELDNGQILLGLDNNGIDIVDRQRGVVGGYRAVLDQTGALPDPSIRALMQTTDGAIWVGTQRKGVVWREPGGKLWQTVAGLPSPLVRALLQRRDGSVWAATGEGLARWQGAHNSAGQVQFEAVPDEHGKPMQFRAHVMVEDAQGRLWAGTENGLWVLPVGAAGWHSIQPEPGRPDSLVSALVVGLLVDSRNNLWVATDKGLERLRHFEGKVARFEHIISRPSSTDIDWGSSLLEDPAGRIWTDLAVFDQAQQQAYSLGKAVGMDMGGSVMGAYAKTRDGWFLFGGMQGLAMIKPNRFQVWNYMPPVVLSGLQINGQTTPLGSLAKPQPVLTLRPGQRDFVFEFAALDYSEPKKNRYQYRLQGYDKNWISTDSDHRSAAYGNLWPGSYTFEVRGSNRAGQWSTQELRIPVRVLPAFWQTGWFVALLLLCAGSGAIAALRWREAHVRTKARATADALQNLVDARTADILKLSVIGQELTATLDMEQAFERVYRQVQARLDADVFMIGIVEPGGASGSSGSGTSLVAVDGIAFVYKMEHRQRLPNTILDREDGPHPALWCVCEQRELILDSRAQWQQFVSSANAGGLSSLPPPDLADNAMETVVYLPLLAEQAVIGCLSVQSPQVHAYDQDQLEFLRILASYTAIALSNSAAHNALTQSHEELAAALDYLKETQAKLIQAERQQISLDLHDNLSQTMTGVLLQLDTAREVLMGDENALPLTGSQQQTGLPYVERAIELARDGISQTRHLLNQLRNAKNRQNKPAPINLVDALRRDLPRLTVGTVIRVTVEQLGQPLTLPAALELVLFRIAQEAVTNALRHAAAKKIQVTLNYGQHCVVLAVCDDGKGFDPSCPDMKPGIGLSGMKQRVGQLSGTLVIDSGKGTGTCITATMPLMAVLV